MAQPIIPRFHFMKFVKVVLIAILVVIILGGAAAAVIYFVKNKETKALTYNLRKSTNGSYVELSNGVTHYELDGPDSGKVVVLLHGYSVPYYIWNGTYEYLARHGFKVLRYDMYGRGYSDRPDVVYNKELYLTQLKELINKLDLKTPVSVAGISFGGAVATDFTIAYPELVSKVILIDPAYNLEKPDVFPLITEFKEVLNADDRAYGQTADFKYPDRFPSWVEQYKPQMDYKGFRHAMVSTGHNYLYNGREQNTKLNSAGKQVLLVWGKEDKTVPFAYSDSVRSVLKAEFLPVNDAAHLPYLEQPGIVNPVLVSFLQK